MDKNDLKIIFDIALKADEVADAIDKILYIGASAPAARGYNEGFFGELTRLYDILQKYSIRDTDEMMEIIDDESLTKEEKFLKLFGHIKE